MFCNVRRMWPLLGLCVAAGCLCLCPVWAQKAPSAKELVALAENDGKNNRWDLAYEKLKQASAQKPKDAKIAEALLHAATSVADKAAGDAINLCDKGEIAQCEKEAARAKTFADTARVKEAETLVVTRKKEIQDRWSALQQNIRDGNYAAALTEIDALQRFSYLLPATYAGEKDRVRVFQIEGALELGRSELKAEKWDAAMDAFRAAQRLDPGNSAAVRGLESARQEKDAALSFQQAQNAYQSKGYQVAWDACNRAGKLFPDRKQYQDLSKKIGADWAVVLMEDAKKLSANLENQKNTQAALDALDMVRKLNSKQPGLADELRTVRLALFSIYVTKATQYESVTDNSRIALAYAFYANAQQINQSGEFAFQAKLKEARATFDRKRAAQLLFKINNLSTAAPGQADALDARVKAMHRKLGLTDLKLRTPEEYAKSKDEDPQFVETRPDGKSPTVQLTVDLTNYDAQSSGDDKPVDKPSKFIAGQEMVPNPLYQKIQADYDKVKENLSKVKPGKVTTGMQQDFTLLQQQLAATPREIAKDKTQDYVYQEYQLNRQAVVRMNLELRDMLEGQLIASDTIEVIDKRNGTEIGGVRERDANQLMNKQARLPSAESILAECQRTALQQLDQKLANLVVPYVQRFFAEGEKARREGRVEDAVENYLCHWYFFRGRLTEEQSEQIRAFIKSEIGFDLNPGN